MQRAGIIDVGFFLSALIMLELLRVVACVDIELISSAGAALPGTKRSKTNYSRMIQIDVLNKPIERIKETCAMMGIAEKFDRALPELETFLEGEVAKGETRETRLTYEGLCYLRRAFAKS